MLENLHVKNLALIDEIEVNFRPGLNILTGETGAGKAILLGSVDLALGGRFHADMLRTGAKFGLVELTFTIENPVLEEQLTGMDIFPEEGRIVLSRKLMPGRSVSKINGETVNMATLKDVASMLIDIHGQHEHQSLLHKKNHLAFLDLYAREQVEKLKKETANAFHTYHACRKKLDESGMDERERQKEISLAEFEVSEIEEAGLSEGEDEEVEALYRRMSAGKKVTERIAEAYHYTSEDENGNASEWLSRAIHALSDVESVDEEGAGLYQQLIEIDSLLNDFNRELSEYAKSLEFSEEEFQEAEERLNVLNHLKAKYGKTLDLVLKYQEGQQERLAALEDYDAYLAGMEQEMQESKKHLTKLCTKATEIRKRYGEMLSSAVREHLVDLNFLNVAFEMRFDTLGDFTAGGLDDAEFFISTNPGEPLRPLMKIASGGELSRIMLAVKTVLADKDDIDTVIFDEIDTGISGRTAQKVSEKMMLIGKNRQVICITHLAQIAAMADSHFRIEKQVKEGETKTQVRRLNEKESIEELARILGGAAITDAVIKNAEEMKRLAEAKKC